MTPWWLFIILVFALRPCLASSPVPIFTKAPFPSAHASTIVQLRNGDLLTAWFGGTAEGKPDVAVWSSRRHAGHWSSPVEIAREPKIACYNPVLFYTKDNRLWLYYKFGPHPTTWSAARRSSDDDGVTWSSVDHLPAGVTGPIRTKPLIMPDGTVVSGTSVESYHSWAVWIERSSDDARTWTRIGPITIPDIRGRVFAPGGSDPFKWADTYGIIQPSIVDLGSGHLRLYARATSQIGHICTADSVDEGRSWSDAHAIALPNPNSGVDAIRLRDGRIVVAYNDSPTDRTPLTLAISADGVSFHIFRVVESGPGEFSYPAIIQALDGGVELTYTWKRQHINYLHVPATEIPGVQALK